MNSYSAKELKMKKKSTQHWFYHSSLFSQFHFENLYGIITIILHPHLHEQFPCHFQSKWTLRFYYSTKVFFKRCIFTFSMFLHSIFKTIFECFSRRFSHCVRENLLRVWSFLQIPLLMFHNCFFFFWGGIQVFITLSQKSWLQSHNSLFREIAIFQNFQFESFKSIFKLWQT